VNSRKANFEPSPQEGTRKKYPLKKQMKKGNKLDCLGCSGNSPDCKGCEGKGYIII
jgi:hypothetical protein